MLRRIATPHSAFIFSALLRPSLTETPRIGAVYRDDAAGGGGSGEDHGITDTIYVVTTAPSSFTTSPVMITNNASAVRQLL